MMAPACPALEPRPSLAELVAGLVGVPSVILALHQADHRGDCCVCSLPQGGKVRFPCTLAVTARAAKRITQDLASR